MEMNLNDLKSYIDSVYGEDNGKEVSGVLRCRFNDKGELELRIFMLTWDRMFTIATIDKQGTIYSTLTNSSIEFGVYSEEDIDEYDGIEDIYRMIVGTVLCDYEEYLRHIEDVTITLNELIDVMIKKGQWF